MFSEDRSRQEEFLSEEDLELAQMFPNELMETWNAWLIQAQETNDSDAEEYSHGVFQSPARARQLWNVGNEESPAMRESR